MPKSSTKQAGFTIVELLLVIAVIAILAAITIVAYSGIQARARDAIRQEDVTTITKALELYYIDKGYYPNATNYSPGSTAINSGWSTTTDGSWSNLVSVLNPYINKLPVPPGSSSLTPAISGGNNYDYFGFSDNSYCGSSAGRGYLLVSKEEGAQLNSLNGNCTGTPVGPYGGASNYRMVK